MMSLFYRVCAATVCSAILFAPSGQAGSVTLSDGTKLIGEIEQLANGKFRIITGFAGTIEFDASIIVALESDQPVTVGVETGDRLVGNIEWDDEQKKPIVMTQLGAIPVPLEKVFAIWRQGAMSPEEIETEKRLAALQEGITAKLPKWSGTLELGATGKEGNKDQFLFRGGAEIRRTTDVDSLRFYITGEYTEQDDIRNSAEVKVGGAYEYTLTDRFFAFARTIFEYDEFENLDLRATLAAGGGYYFVKEGRQGRHPWSRRCRIPP